MDKTRLLVLNGSDATGNCVVYVMSRDQRARDNHSLLFAQDVAIQKHLPLIVLFKLHAKVGFRSYEHFAFMLAGLEEVAGELKQLGIPLHIISGSLLSTLKELKPAAVFLDFSPLKGPRKLAKSIAKQIACYIAVVDTHNIVPVWIASTKQEFAAHTMRSKIHQHLADYLIEPAKLKQQTSTAPTPSLSISFKQAWQKLDKISRCGIELSFNPGRMAADKRLKEFIDEELESYAIKRNDISQDHQSGLSPYLHYGQISSLRVALEVMKEVKQIPLLFEQAKMAQASEVPNVAVGMNALFEEMIVRKELSDNFCLYAGSYSTLNSVPFWAKDTLKTHETDLRDNLYSLEQLETATTKDEAWNAAQRQLLRSGKIHGYMRMYWAKKILEWSINAESAIDAAIYLNDKYSIDGGDPNGYVGILWSIAGLHDRPWSERPIFGKIRYMNQAGLKRKFDLDAYVRQWS